MTNLFLLLLCSFNLALYIGDPHVEMIVVFCAVSERLILTPERFCFFNPSLIHSGSDLPRALFSGADAVCQKRFFGKNQCVVLLQRSDGADREIYEVSISREFKVVLYGYNAASSRHGCFEQVDLIDIQPLL